MIRKMTVSDREVYIELATEFYKSPAVLHSIPKEFIENAFDEAVSSDKYLECYILETQNGEIAGYALLVKGYSQEAGGKVVWLDEFYIREEYRGKGLGGEFLGYLTENVPAARIRLETEPENTGARKLYERYGFKPLGYSQMVKENK